MTRPPLAIPTLLEADGERAIVAGDLRLVFRLDGDRWAHSLVGADRAEFVRSVEVNGDDPSRVPSPTYQELHFQAESAAMLAFLVGQSGPHHFSAVFRVEILGDSRVTIEIDFADRCRTPVAALAATYLVLATSSQLVEADGSSVLWDLDTFALLAEALDRSRLAIAEGGRRGTQLQVDAPIEAGSSTHRCRYRWVWTTDPTP